MRPLALVAAATILLAAGTAAAQPGNTPLGAPPPTYAPPPAIEIDEKSPATALILSLGGTVGSFALVTINARDEADYTWLASVGGLGIWIAPSFGHWYAGDIWTTGLSYRLGGGAALFGSLMWFLADCGLGDSHGGGDDDCGSGPAVLAIGGAAAFVGGTIYDIATAPGAARRRNERERARVQGLMLAPTVTRDQAGLVLAGRF